MPLSCRQHFREALNKPSCLSPASVYDPLSARLAESLGYRLGVLGGSIASFSTLAAPDVMVMTLTEVAEQVRRIVRASRSEGRRVGKEWVSTGRSRWVPYH